MRLWRADTETLVLAGIDPLVRRFLEALSLSADPNGQPAVLDRLYASPTSGGEPEFDAEWRELVAPELRLRFEEAQHVVERDLAQLSAPGGAGDEMRLPIEHLESWISALNQARLAIAARHGFTQREMESDLPEDPRHARPLLQMHFYGLLQQHFLHELGW